MNGPWFAKTPNPVSTKRPQTISSYYFCLCQEMRTETECSLGLWEIPVHQYQMLTFNHCIMLNHYMRFEVFRTSTDFVVGLNCKQIWIEPLLCASHILHKYFRNTEQFILHLHFFINQKELSDSEYFLSPIFRVLKNTDQIFILWKFCKKQKALKNPIFHTLVLAVASVARSFYSDSFTGLSSFIHCI